MSETINLDGTNVENFLEYGDDIENLQSAFEKAVEQLKANKDAGPMTLTVVISNDFEHDEEDEESEDEESDDTEDQPTKEG